MFLGPLPSALHTVGATLFLNEEPHLQAVCVMRGEATWRKSPKGPALGFTLVHAPLGTLSQSRRTRAQTQGGEGAQSGGTVTGEGRGREGSRGEEGRGEGREGGRGSRLEKRRPGRRGEDRGESGGSWGEAACGGVREGAGRGRGAADVGRGRRGGLWPAAARRDTAIRGEDEPAPRPYLPAKPVPCDPRAAAAAAVASRVPSTLQQLPAPPWPRPSGRASAASSGWPASCPWPRLGWLQVRRCASRPLALPEPQRARGLGAVPGGRPRREPGLRRWRRAPCAHLPPPRRQRAAERSTACRAPRNRLLCPFSPLPLSHRHLRGLPAPSFLLPPPDRPCPRDRAVAGASIPMFGNLAAAGGGGGR